MSSNTVLMINLQQGYQHALELSKRKRMCQNPRTTLNWSDQDEEIYQAAVNKCRVGSVVWITHHAGLVGDKTEQDQ